MPTSILFRIIIDTHYFQGATSYACLKKELKEHRRRVQEHNHIMIMQQGVMRVNSKVRYANVISKVGHLTNLTISYAEIQYSELAHTGYSTGNAIRHFLPTFQRHLSLGLIQIVKEAATFPF